MTFRKKNGSVLIRRLTSAGRLPLLIATICGLSTHRTLAVEPVSFDALQKEYAGQTHSLLERFCLKCHSTDRQEGELDLERFATVADVRKAPRIWQKVAENLDNGEMPPKKARQPSLQERKQLRAWVERYLNAEAHASAGDPGPVVLRRLSNAEYTYTVRDLTGLAELQPAREFPADGAAGEGFTNTGNALVMSPALLTKYFDAGKEIARHAVLLPDGFRFSASVTRSDWTNEILDRIRAMYREYSDSQGATRVNLQGIVFDTNDGGRLPVEKYLAATIVERESLSRGAKSPAVVAAEHKLNAKYLASLWNLLNGKEPSQLLDLVRVRWRTARPEDAAALAAEIAQWQNALTRFQSVGHMKSWMVAVNPVTNRQEIRWKLPAAAPGTDTGADPVTVYLAAGEAGDGAAGDFLVWERPRLVTPGRPDLALRDLRPFAREMSARRARLFAATAKSLEAAAEAGRAAGPVDVNGLSQRHGADPEALAAWLDYLGIGGDAVLKLDHFKDRIENSSGYDFIKGWGKPETPIVIANSSEQHVRVPGNMKPHALAVHPSPTLYAVVGWRSPIAGTIGIAGKVTHAHPECGNGVTWSLELRRGATRQRLAVGTAAGAQVAKVGPVEQLAVQPGDLVSLLVGPRDGNHACDLTDVELSLKQTEGDAREWNLTQDVTGNILAGNPHADRLGNESIWHFYTEPVKAGETAPVIPAGSVLARWQAAGTAEEKGKLAHEVQTLLTSGPPPDANHPDAVLYRQLSSLGGPLLAAARAKVQASAGSSADASGSEIGLDPALFGRHPNGAAIDAASLCVQAPSVIEVRLPADLVAGSELVTSAILHSPSGSEGSVQVQVAGERPKSLAALRSDVPVLFAPGSAASKTFEQACEDFRRWFPAALCYTRIVPVDEVVTLTLHYREDEPLARLMLDDKEKARLDRLWDELHFVSGDALTLVDAFAQLMEYATQDSDPKLFEPFRKPINDQAAAYRKALVEAEPRQLSALVDFCALVYRRPLSAGERDELRGLYHRLREQELPHEEALRFVLARLFVSPAFLYRLEQAPPGKSPGPISDWELANRLSYLLWSSMPDAELRAAAAAGRLSDPGVLVAQAQRMLKDSRVRRLATEFVCQWLHIYDFDALDEKSERHFPEFTGLRGDMYEEAIRFATDLFQRDGSVVEFWDCDHTFVNEPLASFYGIPDVTGPEWRRVDGVRKYARGGLLGFAATLGKQSGASRTSPILRGNWISEVLLGEKLPKPPKGVPQLPEDETATEGLTVRQLVEKHSSDPTCATCHVRIDPFGYALEGFDAIGRHREKDLAGRPIGTHAKVQDGTEFEGIDGIRKYLLTARRDAILRQFCRKLLGYSLGRGVQLSDGPLLDDMQRNLERHEYRFSAALETILRSRQFREIRGQEAELDESL